MTIRSRNRTFLEKRERDRVERFLSQTNQNLHGSGKPNDAGSPMCRCSFPLAVLVGAVVVLSLSYSMLADPLATLGDRKLVVEEKVRAESSPFTSSPPERIPLDTQGHVRHRCLQSIRRQHETLLHNYVASAASILLVDPAYHSNVGDHMITLGELSLITSTVDEDPARTIPPAVLSQCSYIQAGNYVPPCDEVIANVSVGATTPVPRLAIWHGGGNWGTLWPRAQEPRIQSFAPLLQAGYAIITMPNSWFYQDEASERADIDKIRRSIAAGLNMNTTTALSAQSDLSKRVIFTWREQYSYDKAVQNFPFVTNLLVPDIAFQLGPYPVPLSETMLPDVDLLVLLRDDHESTLNAAVERNRLSFRKLLDSADTKGSSDVTFSIVDWPDRLHRFRSDDIFFTDTAIQLLGLGRVVICDRLHAAILAYLAGMPFVYVDPISGKISKTLAVAMNSSTECSEDTTWRRARNLTEAVTIATELLQQTAAVVPRPSRHDRRNRLRHQLQTKSQEK